MAAYEMIVLSRPVEGREAEYNEWYQNVHLPQMVTLEGFRSARRLRMARNLAGTGGHPYAAIYQIETDDIDRVLDGLRAAAASGRLTMSAALDIATICAAVYEVCGKTVSAEWH